MRSAKVLTAIILFAGMLFYGCVMKDMDITEDREEDKEGRPYRELLIPDSKNMPVYFFYPEKPNGFVIPVNSDIHVTDINDVKDFVRALFNYNNFPDYIDNIYNMNYVNSIDYYEGLVTIDFNNEFLSKYDFLPGRNSLLLHDSLTKTLAQHPLIKEILLTINGKEDVVVSRDGIEYGRRAIQPTQRIVNYYNPLKYKIDVKSIVTVYFFLPELLDYEYKYVTIDSSGKVSEHIIEVDEYSLIPVSLQLSSNASMEELIITGLRYLIGEEAVQYKSLVSIFSPEVTVEEIEFYEDEVTISFGNMLNNKRRLDETDKFILEFFKQFKGIRKLNIYY
jgi:hypothetical protein